MKHISSADNAQFKSLVKLVHSSRERRLAGYSLLDGVHLVQAYRARFGAPAQLIVSRSGASHPEVQALMPGDGDVLLLDDGLFKQLSSVATPTGIIAVIRTPRPEALPQALETCVMLEDIQDPGNMGSILRSCAAADIKLVFLSKQTVNAWSPRVLRAGMGAHFCLAIHERVELTEMAKRFPGRVLVTQAGSPRSVFDADLAGNVAFVFGNEGAGVSSALSSYADEVITVPMSSATESLNVAAAVAVCLFERVRQIR